MSGLPAAGNASTRVAAWLAHYTGQFDQTTRQACEWLANTETSLAIRESVWVYPLVQTLHVMSLPLFLGILAVLDLRLLRLLLRRTAVSHIVERLLPIALGGFAIAVASGWLLFWSNPTRFYQNPFFQWKVLLLALAGLNALTFHMTVYRRVSKWDTSRRVPGFARAAGGTSLVIWSAVVIVGRMIAYSWFE